MILHVPLRYETLMALRAGERPLIAVNTLMYLQVLLLGEAFATRGKAAAEGLSAVVNMHMRFQPNAPLETFPAAFVGAAKEWRGRAHRLQVDTLLLG